MIYELNSTLKACLIAGFFPYFLFFTQNIKKGKYKFNAILIIAIITLFISVILESRTLTGATLLSLILWHKESSWITKHFSLILSGSLLLIITLLLIKWHSSLGRLFIWKTAIGEISDYWLSGIGKGNFKYYYAEWQSEWFRNNANFSSFHLVADCPEYAFNEYLHLWIEFGLIALIILLFFTYFILKIVLKKSREIEATAAMGSANILLFALISYPLHSFWVIILLNFSVIIIFLQLHVIRIIKYSLLIMLLIFTCIQVQKAISYFDVKLKWAAANRIPDINDRLNNLYQIYQHQTLPGEYISDYASQLIAAKNFHMAENILNDKRKKINQYYYHLYMGEIFKVTRNFKIAIIQYENAHFLIPSRLIPLYNLMKINLQEGNLKKALTWKKIILSTPVKVNSQMVQLIKQEAEKVN